MTIDQLTDIAYEVTYELEPTYSFDVFEVTESQILFHSEHGLKRVCVSCLDGDSLKGQIKTALIRFDS
jgi:hypothetical protein